jgi:hypothetical protein
MIITSERLFLFDIGERKKNVPIKLLFCARLSRKGDQDLNSKLYVSKENKETKVNYENDLGFFLLFCEQEYTGHNLSWIGEREYVRYIIYKFPKTSEFSMNKKVLSHLFSVKNSSINDKFDLCERQNMMFRYGGQIYSVTLDGKPDEDVSLVNIDDKIKSSQWFLYEKFTFLAVESSLEADSKIIKFFALYDDSDDRGWILKQYYFDE